jgi:N-acetylmuramoyl-L-alanine amidase
MKKYYIICLFSFIAIFLLLNTSSVKASLPLSGVLIVIDPGHGGKDVGAIVNDIYEKEINLAVSLELEKELIKNGASVVLTRYGDYDLSSPNSNWRKKSDFDNRIKLINDLKPDFYLSIHQNYLSDFSYSGPQVFYDKYNEELASVMQEVMNKELNGTRDIKKIPSDTYMYSKLKVPGLLIECGFLSNNSERNKLLTREYQAKLAESITNGLIKYFL